MPQIAMAAGIVIAVLLAALGFMFWAYTGQVEQRVIAEVAAVGERVAREKEHEFAETSKNNALEHEEAKANLRVINERLQGDIDRRILQANYDAETDPLNFGDDFVRDFARSMCIIQLGKFAREPDRVESCYIRAAAFNPSTVNFTVAYGPSNLRRWADACDARSSVFAAGTVIEFVREDTGETIIDEDSWNTEEEWQATYPEISPEMCIQSIVAFTPQGALMFQKYFLRVENYVTGLNMDIDIRDAAIDMIMNPSEPE